MTESECKQGIETIRKFTEETRAIIEKNNITIAEHNALKKIYERDLLTYNTVTVPAWQLKYDTELNKLRDEVKVWKNCAAHGQCDPGVHNDWCSNEFGAGWGHTGKSGDCNHDSFGTPWGCKGKCQRNWYRLSLEMDSWVAANPKPLAPVAPVMGKLLEHGAIPNSIINCCTNVANIIASEITDSNISQFADCVANIQGLPDPGTGSSGAAGTGTAGTTTAPSKETTTPTVNVISEKKPDPEPSKTSNVPLYAAIGLGGLALVSLAFV